MNNLTTEGEIRISYRITHRKSITQCTDEERGEKNIRFCLCKYYKIRTKQKSKVLIKDEKVNQWEWGELDGNESKDGITSAG